MKAAGRSALRLPDHKGQEVLRCYGQHQPLVRGYYAPDAARGGYASTYWAVANGEKKMFVTKPDRG